LDAAGLSRHRESLFEVIGQVGSKDAAGLGESLVPKREPTRTKQRKWNKWRGWVNTPKKSVDPNTWHAAAMLHRTKATDFSVSHKYVI
jgi:hypothetical protein